MDFKQAGDWNLLRRINVADHEFRSLLPSYGGSSILRCGLQSHGRQLDLFWILVLLLTSSVMMYGASAQQAYNNDSGYTCPASSSSCNSTILYRTQTSMETFNSVSTLFNASVDAIVNTSGLQLHPSNNPLASATPLYIPITCSCLNGTYQEPHVSMLIVPSDDTFLSIANAYEHLTTVHALATANPSQDTAKNLKNGSKITIPLRCACPSTRQENNGTHQLLTYVISGETLDVVGSHFSVSVADLEAANKLNASTKLQPNTTLLVPLATLPPLSSINLTTLPPTSPPPNVPPPPPPPGPPPGPPPNVTSPPPPPSPPPTSNIKLYVGLGIGIGTCLVVASLFGFFLLILACQKRFYPKHGHGDPALEPEFGERLRGNTFVSSDGFLQEVWLAGMSADVVGSDKPMVFSYEELREATMDFSDAKRIQGSVFLGKVRGTLVAIKQMKGNMTQPELKIPTQVHHANLVKLIGICQNNTSRHQYFVYEYAENGSLGDCLHNKNDYKRTNFLQSVAIFLPWTTRIHIALDVASGLDYIHNYTNPSFVHQDVKSRTILLDGNFRAKITNFGMAKSANASSRTGPMLTKDIMGTQGYMAPEYLEHGLVTPKADVFAFGVVLLEILSGKEAMVRLVEGRDNGVGEEARPLSSLFEEVLEGDNYKEKLQAWMDPLLQNAYPLDTACSMANLAKKCLVANPALRPNMKDINYALSKMLVSSLEWESFVLYGTRDKTDVSNVAR